MHRLAAIKNRYQGNGIKRYYILKIQFGYHQECYRYANLLDVAYRSPVSAKKLSALFNFTAYSMFQYQNEADVRKTCYLRSNTRNNMLMNAWLTRDVTGLYKTYRNQPAFFSSTF